ncbi:MAG: nickel-responsive transcriptional regulator NikR [Phycisphaerae bacterium]|nr:nickel-responsive transcriptional regulator NikR [Phycisphaerae bacterium]
MQGLERIGVSLDKDLLAGFDALIAEKGYASRSEAIRDLIRQDLSEAKLDDPHAQAFAAVLLVYDHHVTRLSDKLLDLQHSHLLETISSLHVHLDHHHCLEVIVLRGSVGQIRRVGDQMASLKGVRLGRVNLVTVKD